MIHSGGIESVCFCFRSAHIVFQSFFDDMAAGYQGVICSDQPRALELRPIQAELTLELPDKENLRNRGQATLPYLVSILRTAGLARVVGLGMKAISPHVASQDVNHGMDCEDCNVLKHVQLTA